MARYSTEGLKQSDTRFNLKDQASLNDEYLKDLMNEIDPEPIKLKPAEAAITLKIPKRKLHVSNCKNKDSVK